MDPGQRGGTAVSGLDEAVALVVVVVAMVMVGDAEAGDEPGGNKRGHTSMQFTKD